MDGLHQASASCLAITLCALASLGGISIGYDFGVSSRVVRMDSFLESFCVGYDKNTLESCRSSTEDSESWKPMMALYNVMYCLGCVCGAFLGGWIADRWGRRKAIFVGAFVYCCATLCVVSGQSRDYVMVLAARFVQGMGTGEYSVAILAFTLEIAPSNRRGLFTGMMQLAAATGFVLAPSLARFAKDFEVGMEMQSASIEWKLAAGFAAVPQLVVIAVAFFLPESPRWAYRHNGRLAAAVILHRLHPKATITRELNLIDDEVTRETQRNGHCQASSSLGDLWRVAPVRRRVIVTMTMQVLQQATAASTALALAGPIFELATKEVKPAGKPEQLTGVDMAQVLAGVGLAAIFPALGLVETLGRRLMLLVGAAGMFLGYFGAGLALALGCHGAAAEDIACTKLAMDCFIVATAFSVGMTGMSWGPVCWTYSAEVFGFHLRARAISMSAVATWSTAAAMVYSAAYNREKNVSTALFLLAFTCVACGLVAFFWCVETKGVDLEKVESLFCQHAPTGGEAKVKSEDVVTPSIAESEAPYRMESTTSSIDKVPYLI